MNLTHASLALTVPFLLNLASLPVYAQSTATSKQEFYFNLPENDEDSLTNELEGEINFGLTGRRYDDAVINSRWGRAAVGLELKKNFNTYLSGKFSAEQRFTSGASSNYFTVNEGAASPQATLLDEASLTLKPFENIKASLGILPVGLNPIYSSMGLQSWASGKIFSDFKMGTSTLSVSASQSTPSAGGTSNRALDDDTLPLFTQGSLMLEVNPLEKLRLRAAYSSFVFTDPSSRTAEDSRFNGSTILGTGPYIFAYDYKGSEVAADTKIILFLDDEFSFKASEITNDKAPEGRNKGSGWRLEYKKTFDRYEVTGAINGFRTESDALPSIYGTEFAGFTNRVGNGISMKVVIPKQNIGFMAGYTKADVINRAATTAGIQADREVYTLKTEIAYDLF